MYSSHALTACMGVWKKIYIPRPRTAAGRAWPFNPILMRPLYWYHVLIFLISIHVIKWQVEFIPGTPPSWRVYVLTWFLEQGVKPGFIQITPRVPSVLQYLWVCAHISHTFCVFLFFIYHIIFVNNDALTCISALKRSCDFCCPISPLYAGTEFQA